MLMTTTPVRRLLAAAGLGALALAAPASAEEIGSLTIIAPANPGGGWDQTARAMQEVLQAEHEDRDQEDRRDRDQQAAREEGEHGPAPGA